MNSTPETKAADTPARMPANTPKRCGQTNDSSERVKRKISVFKNAKGIFPSGETTLEDLYCEIRDGVHRTQIERIRAEQDEEQQKELKKQLKAVTLSGKVTSGKRKFAMQEGRFAHSGFLQIDIDADDLQGQPPADVRDDLAEDPHIVTAFLSPRGNGVKAVMLVPPAATKDDHTATFLSAERYMLDSYELKVDTATKDPVRMCFVSYDPEARWNSEAVPLVPITAAPSPSAAKTSKTSPSLKVGSKHATPKELTPQDVREMLATIPPHPPYDEWLKIASAVWDALGEAEGTAALCVWSPEEHAGEYAAKYPKRYERVTAGTLVHTAKEHGWKRERYHSTSSATSTAAGTRTEPSEDRITFDPRDVFYDGPSGKYLVDAGDYFRTLGRKSPVITGVIRHFKSLGCDEKEAKEAARNEIADAEIDRHVEWSGNLAGHKKGLMESVDGRPMLILTSPAIPEPITAPCPVILEIIRQAFPDDTQRNVFLGWLSGSYKAVRAGQHHPAPMLVLAGKVNAGKSLLALIAGYVMGGRTANPHSAWSGSMVWNDDLFGSELLLLDDSTGSTDIRARLNFAASFKESIYDANVQLRKRHTTSMSARPVWRVMVCCNDNAESLLIVPPIGTDMADKIALLKVSKITPPVDASNTEGQAVLRTMIREELPAFAAILLRFQIPEELRDSRAGITAWRHPELAAALESTKPDHRLEELLETAIRSSYHLWSDLPATLKASEIEGRLLDKDSPVREQAKTLFGTWTAACGTYLGRLADGGSEIVKRGGIDGHAKIGSYTVSLP